MSNLIAEIGARLSVFEIGARFSVVSNGGIAEIGARFSVFANADVGAFEMISVDQTFVRQI